MQRDTERCDRCESVIVHDPFDQPHPYQFVFEEPIDDDGHVTYNTVARILCGACEDELLTWIDEGDVDRSNQVDLPTGLVAASGLRMFASDLGDVADLIEDELGWEENERGDGERHSDTTNE